MYNIYFFYFLVEGCWLNASIIWGCVYLFPTFCLDITADVEGRMSFVVLHKHEGPGVSQFETMWGYTRVENFQTSFLHPSFLITSALFHEIVNNGVYRGLHYMSWSWRKIFKFFFFFLLNVPWLLILNKRMIWIKNICLLPWRLHVHSEVNLGMFELKLSSVFIKY